MHVASPQTKVAVVGGDDLHDRLGHASGSRHRCDVNFVEVPCRTTAAAGAYASAHVGQSRGKTQIRRWEHHSCYFAYHDGVHEQVHRSSSTLPEKEHQCTSGLA